MEFFTLKEILRKILATVGNGISSSPNDSLQNILQLKSLFDELKFFTLEKYHFVFGYHRSLCN